MITVKVYFEDGNTIVSSINGCLKDAMDYYIGQSFNFGDTDHHPKDKMVRAIAVMKL